MGYNDSVDIKAGGPGLLSFWVFTNLETSVIEKIAKSREIQDATRSRGGDGTFMIRREWATAFVATEEEFKTKCLELASQF